MCGIVGTLAPNRAGADLLDHVRFAVESMRHRGPDDEVATEVAGGGAWGMCRLAIRDPSPAGRQPFWYGRIGVIFNGEIYNTAELTKTLEARGHSFSSGCDTEVLLKAYVEFGSAAFGLLDGIFAVAVVDPDANEFLLARDEFGVKPLFVHTGHRRLSFASEPKALRTLGGLDDGIDEDMLVRYLRYQYVPEPGAPWRNVRRLPRGTVEVFALDTLRPLRSERFVQPGADLPLAPTGSDDWADITGHAVRLSVERQMISDRPLGVFLSGGIDSTLISAYASEIHPRLRAFGISVPGWERDERQYMEEACAHLDVDLSVTELTEGDFDRLTDKLLQTYDEPFADFSAIPTMLVSEAAGEELRVVLSGDGGDELFGGYQRYGYAPYLERLGSLPPIVLKALRQAMRVSRRGPSGQIAGLIDEIRGGGHGYAAMLAIRDHDSSAALLGRSADPAWALAPRNGARAWRSPAAHDVAMAIDLEQYLPADIHTKVDRATMAVSLEARVPLLGGPVARLAAAMPADVKIQGGVGKWPLKELLRRRGFTDEFVHRRKAGFSFPMSDWLRRAIDRRPEYEDLLRRPPAPLDSGATSAELERLLAGADSGHSLWSLLVLSAWLTRNT